MLCQQERSLFTARSRMEVRVQRRRVLMRVNLASTTVSVGEITT
jgi:hypothetical protein